MHTRTTAEEGDRVSMFAGHVTLLSQPGAATRPQRYFLFIFFSLGTFTGSGAIQTRRGDLLCGIMQYGRWLSTASKVTGFLKINCTDIKVFISKALLSKDMLHNTTIDIGCTQASYLGCLGFKSWPLAAQQWILCPRRRNVRLL